MSSLTISVRNDRFVADSREVAQMAEKRHDHLLRDIDGYVSVLSKSTDPKVGVSDFFIETTYRDSTGRLLKRYDITRKGCDMVANKMIGEKGIMFTAVYVSKFEEMERQLAQPTDLEKLLLNPDTVIKIAQNWKEEQQKRIAAEAKIEADKPKVMFAEAVETSGHSILIGELAKLLKQNGINIGQNRLFAYMRDNGYLMRTPGERWNDPTQRSMDMELFTVKRRTINNPDGSVQVFKTTKVTPKGQIYFVNKFKTTPVEV